MEELVLRSGWETLPHTHLEWPLTGLLALEFGRSQVFTCVLEGSELGLAPFEAWLAGCKQTPAGRRSPGRGIPTTAPLPSARQQALALHHFPLTSQVSSFYFLVKT